jgi:antitoxin component YwqK of YwqJK toxin-antitoxin module
MRHLINEGYYFDDEVFRIEDDELGLFVEESLMPYQVYPELKNYDGAELYEGSEGILDKVFVKNKQRQGQCISYYPSGELKSKCYYWNNLLHGPSLFYSQSGSLLAKGFFVHGKRVGKNWQYYVNENLYSLQQFMNDCSHGWQRYYFESGQLKSEMYYEKGRLEGKVDQYYESGQLFREVEFSLGSRSGFDKQYFENGYPMLEAYFQNNEPVNLLRIWHNNQVLAEDYKYFENPQNFNVYKYDRSGRLWMEGAPTHEGKFEERYINENGRVFLTKHYSNKKGEMALLSEERLDV